MDGNNLHHFKIWIDEQANKDIKATYENYQKIKQFETVGLFLLPYVCTGGVVTQSVEFNNIVDVSDIVASLNDVVTFRDGTEFKTEIPNTTYYLDYSKEGDWTWGTSNPDGVVDVDYLTIAEVKTDSDGMIDTIEDKRETVGGFNLKPEYGIHITGYVTEDELNDRLEEYYTKTETDTLLGGYVETSTLTALEDDLKDLNPTYNPSTTINTPGDVTRDMQGKIVDNENGIANVPTLIDEKNMYYTTTGTSTNFKVEIPNANLSDGYPIKIKTHVDATGSPVIEVDTFSDVSMKNPDGTAFNGKAGYYTFVHNGVNFILASGGGEEGETGLNVFANATIPTSELNGVLINQSLTVSSVISDSSYFSGGVFNTNTTSQAVLSETQGATSIGLELFWANGLNEVLRTNKTGSVALKYTFATTGTTLDMINDGKYLYVLRNESGHKVYRIDILASTVTGTLLTNGSTSGTNSGGLAKVGTSIYIFSKISDRTEVYRYNTVTTNRTQLADIPGATINNAFRTAQNGNYIYFTTYEGSNSKYAVYHLPSGTYRTFAISNGINTTSPIPIEVYDGRLYLSYPTSANFYIVDVRDFSASYTATIVTNPTSGVTGFRDISYFDGEIAFISNLTASQQTRIHRYTLTKKTYAANTIVLKRGDTTTGLYYAQLVNPPSSFTGTNNKLNTYFDDVAYSTGSDLVLSYPSYIGNGVEWIKFK